MTGSEPAVGLSESQSGEDVGDRLGQDGMAQAGRRGADKGREQPQSQPEEQEEAAPGITLEEIISGVGEDKIKETLAGTQPGETVTIAPKVAEDITIELTPEFDRAVKVTMELLDQFIIYERDKPEEARIQMFPAYMHFQQADIDAEILIRYPPFAESRFEGSLEDLKLIQWGIDDALDILRKRTDGSFPQPPGTGPLSDLQFEALSELAHLEASYFFRYSEEDLLRGYVQVSSIHAFSASGQKGSRFRIWITAQKFAKKFIHVLSREDVDDMVAALIEDEVVIETTYNMYFLRWREAGLI